VIYVSRSIIHGPRFLSAGKIINFFDCHKFRNMVRWNGSRLDFDLRFTKCFCISILNKSTRRRKDGFTLCGGGLAPVRMYRSGIVAAPVNIDCISRSVLKRSQFFFISKFVNLGLGTNFKPNPKRFVKLYGGVKVVHKLCTAILVHRIKNCVAGRLAIML
jgi:hypothetical protein